VNCIYNLVTMLYFSEHWIYLSNYLLQSNLSLEPFKIRLICVCCMVGTRCVHLGRTWRAGPKHKKRARSKARHDPNRPKIMHRVGLGPRLRSTDGHVHDPFMKARNSPFEAQKGPYLFGHPLLIINHGNHRLKFS
jgi:hypothetical protein